MLPMFTFLFPSVILNGAPQYSFPSFKSSARSEGPRESFLCHAASGSFHYALSLKLPDAAWCCASAPQNFRETKPLRRSVQDDKREGALLWRAANAQMQSITRFTNLHSWMLLQGDLGADDKKMGDLNG